MITIEILIATFFGGIILGCIIYRSTMTTKEQREIDYKHNLEQTASLEDKIRQINELDRKLKQIIK